MDKGVIAVMQYLPIIKLCIYLLIITASILLIFRLFNIRSIQPGKGVNRAVHNVKVMRNYDATIVSSNKLTRNLARIVQSSVFGLSDSAIEYTQYNINRLQIKAIGGSRLLTAEEFNAIKITLASISIILSLIVALFTNILIGFILIVISIVVFNIMPMQVMRGMVRSKDVEIEENFLNLYLVLHYQLMEGAKGSISKTMRDYYRAAKSKEIKQFINIASGYMDSYGEEDALMRIRSDYREVSQVVKLTRLIKQLYDGGKIENDLIGFRAELIRARELSMEKKMDKLIYLANSSFKVLIIILFQAVISALSIYLPDLGFMFSMFS